MFDEPIPLRPQPFRLTSTDAALQVRFEAGRFLVCGTAEGDGELELSGQHASWQSSYATGSGPRAAVARLESAVQSGVMLLVDLRPDGVSVRPIETTSPAAPLPRVLVLSTDGGLRITPRAVNQLELRGFTDARCLVTLRVDKRAVAVQFEPGASGPAIAARLAQAVPFGYRADADGGVLTVWRDASSTTIAA